jgi:poly(A) polymerase
MEVTRKPHLHQDWIDSHAYGIVKALQKGGFTTYLVGGCVRDLLLGIHPKDFDIATMAHPPQVKRLIYMSFVIGKRFRLVLVKRDDQQFEVATFRRDVNPADFPEGVPPGDNVFGTPEEDARRRDFTINGLFYDPINEQLIDYVNGLPDIQARTLRMIGDPDKRLVEDPIRILRGLRLAHKLGFVIEPELRTAMAKNASSLLQSVLPRRREEILKILRLDDPAIALMECYDLGILQHVVPTLHDLLSNAERRDLFLQHFETYRTMVNDPSDTTQLFGWLVFSMFKAALEGPTERETPITLEDDIFQRLMRDELGMYKFEQSALVKAIEILPAIAKVEDFRRRGERRQLAMIRNEGFQLALRFCEADLLLNGSELEFWRQALTKLSVELERIAAEVKAKKRRPRRRRRTESERLLDGTGNRPTGTSAAPEEKHGGDTSGPDDAEELG